MAIIWENLQIESITDIQSVQRAKVPGGWFVAIALISGGGMTFYPDPEHRWDGHSLPQHTTGQGQEAQGTEGRQ